MKKILINFAKNLRFLSLYGSCKVLESFFALVSNQKSLNLSLKVRFSPIFGSKTENPSKRAKNYQSFLF